MDLSYIRKFIEEFQIFFISDTFDIVVKVVLIYIGALWIALIIWVARDSINRSNSLIFQILAICLNIILPVFGLLIYLIIRPAKTLLEKYYEELEYTALATEKAIEEILCEFCGTGIERDFLFCPYCTKQVKKKCSRCHKVFSYKWSICPYCGNAGRKSRTKNMKDKTH